MLKNTITSRVITGLRAGQCVRKYSSTHASPLSSQPSSDTIDAGAESLESRLTSKEPEPTKKQLTVSEQDALLLEKLESISGSGGGAGVQLEGGKAVGLKRGVRENMFRVI